MIGRLRDSADLVVDTSMLSPHQFKQLLLGHFALGADAGMRISVLSFSYRRGVPREADLVFDVRFLKNPHYVPALKPLSGLDAEVARSSRPIRITCPSWGGSRADRAAAAAF